MLMIFLLIFFMTSHHPFFSAVMLLLYSFSLILMINSFSNWMNFIVCLIYLGGVLILFIYIASISPNKKNLLFFSSLVLITPFLMFSELTKSFIFMNFSKIYFYSPIFFKFWFLFLIFLVLVLILISDLCKISFSSFRIV